MGKHRRKRHEETVEEYLRREAEKQRQQEGPRRRRWTDVGDVGDFDEEEEQIYRELHFDRD